MSRSCWGKTILAATMLACTLPQVAAAQDLLRFLDLKSDDFTKADMTRIEIEAALAEADPTSLTSLPGVSTAWICRGSTSDAASSRRHASIAPTLPAPISTA
jgi:hypothetical protein